MYVLVRNDLPLADQLVQVGYACLEAGSRFQPAPCSSNLIALRVDGEVPLLASVEKIEAAGIRCIIFHEPDHGMGYTAACSEPVSGSQRRVFRTFPLWTPSDIIQAARPPHKLIKFASCFFSPSIL